MLDNREHDISRWKVSDYPIARASEIEDKERLDPPPIELRCRRRLAQPFLPVRHRATAPAMLEPAAESPSDTPSAGRLVIRVKLIPQEPPQPPAPSRSSKSALLLILGAAAVLLSWLAIGIFRADPASPPAATQSVAKADAESPAPVPSPAEAKPVEPEVRPQPDAPLASVDEVIPDVPQSALDTIRGTVRVSVRVTIDKQGAVVDAAADDGGPSRYFERLALEASRKWTFTPANSAERRTMLVRFNFTRDGATAHASPLE